MGIAQGLPVHGAHKGVGRGQRDELGRIADAHAEAEVQRVGELRIKLQVGLPGMKIVFAKHQDGCPGEHVTHKQGFAPAGVGADHVGDKAFFADLQQHAGHGLAAPHGGLCRLQIVVRFRPGPLRRLVGQSGDAGKRAPLHDVALLPYADHGIARPRAHVGRQVHILAGEILVDEKYVH